MPDTLLLLRPTETPATIDKLFPFITGMAAINNLATAYLCQSFACQKPQTSPEKLRKLLRVKTGK